MSESENKEQSNKKKCRSCDGKGEYRHSGGGCSGDALYLPCQMCDGTGDHNEEKYLEARKQGLRISIQNLTAAVERDREEVPMKVKALQDGLESLEEHLEQCKQELADLESGKIPQD